MNLEGILEWYQQRIGLYDKKSWETTVEQRILQGLSYSPAKTAKEKPDLIDVDLIRGSTFPKAKPKSNPWLSGLLGVIRIIFLPVFCQWWLKEISDIGLLLIFISYCSTILSGLIYWAMYDAERMKVIPISEVVLPAIMLVLLSIIISEMACTKPKGITYAIQEKRIDEICNFQIKSPSRRTKRLRRTSVKNSSDQCRCRWYKLKNEYGKSDYRKSLRSRNQDFMKPRARSEELQLFSLRWSRKYSSLTDLASVSHLSHAQTLSELREFAANFEMATHFASPQYNSLYTSTANSPQSPPIVDNVNIPRLSLPKECSLRFRSNRREARTSESTVEELPPYTPPYCFDERGRVSGKGSSSLEDARNSDGNSPSTNDRELSSKSQKFNSRREKSYLPSAQAFLSPMQLNYRKIPLFMQSDDLLNSSCDSDAESPSEFIQPFDFLPSQRSFNVGLASHSHDTNYTTDTDAEWDEFEDATHTIINKGPVDWHIQGSPAAVISSTREEAQKIGCVVWQRNEMMKVKLSVLDITSAIISHVNSIKQNSNYCVFGLAMAIILSSVPTLYRFGVAFGSHENATSEYLGSNTTPYSPHLFLPLTIVTGNDFCSCFVIMLCALNRFLLASCFFFLLSVAERIFKERFYCAKHFSYLTSARRARKYDLPHFRLNKVLNIKSWLSIRSCLKKRGPQHSVDVIVSATFILTLILVFYLGVEALKDDEKNAHPLHNVELFIWCFAISVYLIRLMTLGSQINKKYSNPSVLITEQINMYFQMEKNPQKKENLMLANNVLKLVSVLLEELDCPFKISGLSANTLLYNITKFGILSACSGVLSNLLGFKLKLHNIKFR